MAEPEARVETEREVQVAPESPSSPDPSPTPPATQATTATPSPAPTNGGPHGLPRPSVVVRPAARTTHRSRSITRYRPPTTNTWRFVRAYITTFEVIGSYLWLAFKARLFGKAYRREVLAAVHKRNADRVLSTILELQGLFIKVGQLLSIMANFLPEAFRGELEGLQDQVPPRPYEEIEKTIEQELGGRVRELFASIERTPLASASLGQVHEAKLKDGRRVVVKVQHRDIDEIVRLDLKTIRRIMMIVQWFVPVKGLDAYYHQVKSLLGQELDFELEAANIETIAANFASEPRVKFPTPVRELSTKKVLTTTFLEGKKVGDVEAIEAMGVDTKDVAARLVKTYCQMIFVDGIYHADPHPGNVLVDKNGDLVLLDFGAVAKLSQEMREGIPEFIEAILRRDTDRIIKALRKMGFLSRTSDEAMSEKIIEYFHRRFQEEVKLESFNLKDVKIDPQRGFESLFDLRKMNVGMKEISDAFHIPRDWVLLERTIILLYGCCSLLDPELNPMAIIQPYLQDFVLGRKDWQEIAMETVRDMALSAVTLPDDMRKYLTRATRGEMEVRVKGVQEGARTIYAIGRQIIYTAIAIACGAAALSLHYHGEDQLARWPLGFGGFALFMLIMTSIFGRPNPKKWR
jgi:predicted unusual protein kinase regulating ubiquinone biosynthesis (AarF/ABC1/UbiB family)